MSQVNCNTSRRKFQHINYEKRKIIEVLLRNGIKRREIAEAVGIAESTLSTEIRRGEVEIKRVIREKELRRNYYHGKETVVTEWVYSAEAAQADADEKKKNSIKHCKIFKEEGYVDFIDRLILQGKKKVSPDVANAIARTAGYKCVSTRTLYNWIEARLMKVQTLDLLLKSRRKQQSKVKIQKRKYGKSIDERSKEVEKREEFGHWEGDSIVGAGHKGQIITLVERKYRVGLMFKFNEMRAENIVQVLRSEKTLRREVSTTI